MNVNTKFNEAAAVDPVYFEKVIAEKSGGGIVNNPTEDLKPTTPLYAADGNHYSATPANEDSAVVAILGTPVYAGVGDQPAKIVFSAVVRKETAICTAEDVTNLGIYFS